MTKSDSNPAPGFLKHPRHEVRLSSPNTHVRVSLGGEIIAESRAAVRVEESGYPPRYYLPQSDIQMDRLKVSGRTTHCPFKGDASYWSVASDQGNVLENAAWSYKHPFDECLAIANHIAFYGDEFAIETVGANDTE